MLRDCSGDVGRMDILDLGGLIRVHRVPEVDCLLEIEPELGLSAGKLTEAECGIRGHGSLPVHDLIHPGIGNSEAPRGVLLGDSKRDQKVLEEDLTWVGRTTVLW